MHTQRWIAALLATTPVWAHSSEPGLSGQVRALWVTHTANALGPLAQANQMLPGTAPGEDVTPNVQTELRTSQSLGTLRLEAIGTAEVHQAAQSGQHARAWLNEGVLSGGFGSWQWSAGKKVVAWDVGYAFRPNDVVQQEVRRALAAPTLEGRPLLMAEHFDAQTAWSLVWVNPTHNKASPGAQEPAWAARVYRRAGAVDWHGHARLGTRTGASLGAAMSWVATESVELHASWRGFRHAQTLLNTATGAALVAASPWQTALSGAGQQALIGGTWTNESQFSLLMEVWWDGTAPSRAQWAEWTARNQALPQAWLHGAPTAAVAGNLAWQVKAFGEGQGLQRSNLYARLSWQHEAWQTALDVLYHPADRGRMLTASVTWQGDRLKLEAGMRVNTGPSGAMMRQLPVQREGYLLSTWAF